MKLRKLKVVPMEGLEEEGDAPTRRARAPRSQRPSLQGGRGDDRKRIRPWVRRSELSTGRAGALGTGSHGATATRGGESRGTGGHAR